jgi:hypothetical protein
MAKNEVFENADNLAVAVTQPASPVSGSPVLYGQRPGVALVDKDTVSGLTTCTFKGQYLLSVKGVDAGGNAAVAEGDLLYYVAGDTPVLSKKVAGVRFGYAGGAIASGQTATIPVTLGY